MSVYETLQEHLDVRRHYSNYLSCLCPFPHDGRTEQRPSMFVYEDVDKPDGLGGFHCAGCGKSGTHAYLLKVVTGMDAPMPSMRKSDKFLPKWEKWQEQYGCLEALAISANSVMKSHPDMFMWYFRKRQLLEVVDKYCLGMKDGWALFPIFESGGKIVDIVCRNTTRHGEAKYVVHPDLTRETPYLYVPNWKLVQQSKEVYIVYGMIDAISLDMCGLPVITGSTGKSLSEKRLINLNKHWIIVPDRYEEDAAYNLSHKLGICSSVKLLKYEEDEKDSDDIRMKRGLDVLKSLIGVTNENNRTSNVGSR